MSRCAIQPRVCGKIHHYIVSALVLIAAFVAGVVITKRPREVPIVPATKPSTIPANAPASKPIIASYMDVVHATYPNFPATQPLEFPTGFDESARIIISDPLYLERPADRGDVWITRVDAPEETSKLLASAGGEQAHVLRETVLFSHWSIDDAGKAHANLVIRKSDGSLALVTESETRPIAPADYAWDRARGLSDAITLPTSAGVTIFPLKATEEPRDFVFFARDQIPKNASSPQLLEDARGGLLAWMPWENGKTGSNGAARYIDGKWTKLDSSSNWPAHILQLVPLKDGSVVQMILGDDGSLKVAVAPLEGGKLSAGASNEPAVNPKEIEDLVDQLSAPEQSKRDAAFAELSRFGAGAHAILEKLLPTQSPAAQVRIKSLLHSNISPTLGGMTPLPGPIQTVSRGADGSVVFYLDSGVTLPGPDGEPLPTAPAWLALRPGRAAKLLSDFFIQDLQAGKQRIMAFGDEWIVTDEANGPRRFMENHYQPMLRKNEAKFSRFVGFDRRGRWFFKTESSPTPTLIIDPTLPDFRPRLPVWTYQVKDGKVGWTAQNWPVVDHGGSWVLNDKGWRPLEKDKEKLITEVPEPPAPSTTQSATAPATMASTTAPATTQSSEPPILVDADGTKYFDGLQNIRIVTKDGHSIAWPLPAVANGSGDVWFFHAGEDRFFLFNEPGRVLRLKRTPEGLEAFRLEATFTKNIPSSDNAARIWLDPAGRIVIAHDIDTLTILFPTGQVPPEIARLMPDIAKDED